MSRSRERERAVFALYQHDTTGRALDDLLGDDAGDFARELAAGALARQDALDASIGRHAQGWRVERIAPLERNILRVAVFELTGRDDVPPEVAIDEAVELAKRYCGADAPKFVNGILGAVLRDRLADDTTTGDTGGGEDSD